MPALSSLISYRSQLKDNFSKVASRSPFGKRRVEGAPVTGPNTPPNVHTPHSSQEVIDIRERGRDESLDFCDSATPSFTSQDRPLYTESDAVRSSRLQLQLDLSPDSEPLSDWFSTSFPRAQPSPNALSTPQPNDTQSSVSDSEKDADELLTEQEALKDDMEHMSSQDLIANLEAMDAASFGNLPRQQQPLPTKKVNPSPIKIPQRAEAVGQDEASLYDPSRPMSQISSPLSSAVSGTTIARQLIGNGFILSHDNRSSRYRGFIGLTRSDSTTLPHGDFHYQEQFEVDPEAPPIPGNAEALYVAPKTPRTAGAKVRGKTLKRRSSTGSISTRTDKDSAILPLSPLTRPNSVLVSPTEVEEPPPPVPLVPPASPSFSSLPEEVPQERKYARIPPAIDLEATLNHYSRQSGPPTDLGGLSPRSSTGEVISPKNLEDVLDYYQHSENPEAATQRGFKPVFTPITEESLSQLSPQTPSKDDRRDSQRNQPIGARSPKARPALIPFRRPSDSGIPSFSSFSSPNDRPQSAQRSSSASIISSHKSNSSTSSINNINEPLLPPPLSKLFNRQRSGSAPSPIKVVRNSQDLAKYEIAVDPQPDSTKTTPTTGDSIALQAQSFPETASAFSHGWSAAFASPGLASDENVAPMSDVPLSAGLPNIGVQPSLTQQILLTRAATTVRARHARQGSVAPAHGNSQPSSPLINQTITEESGADDAPSLSIAVPPEVRDAPRHTPPKRSLPSPSLEQPSALPPSPSPLSLPMASLHQDYASSVITRSSSKASSHGHSSESVSTHASTDSSRSRMKSLPPIPPAPGTVTPSSSSQSQISRGPRPRVPPALQLPNLPSTVQVLTEEPQTIAGDLAEISSSGPVPLEQPAQSTSEEVSHTESPSLPLQSSLSHKSTNTIDEILRASTSLGSPPPYYSVIDHLHPSNQASSGVGNAGSDAYIFGPHSVASSSSPVPWSSVEGPRLNSRDSAASRGRLRPPLPAGPRRPSLLTVSSPITQNVMRDRSGSISSVGSTVRHDSTRRVQPSPLVSPKFQTPPVKWRGYTLEVAKWTFSSVQLQAVVSRAIRESALTSSIRLLKLESLEGEIPEEIHRLEMQRTDAKSKYKSLSRRRSALSEALISQLTRAPNENPSFALRIAEELKDVSASLDRLAEELHSADQQIAQLEALVQVHSASALSVALRKLNGSLMKQMAENKSLQDRVDALEAERDEAWNQAQQIADEYDHVNFNEKVEPQSSKRSSIVSAKRKSSIRASKAGLRSLSRRQSQQSSIGSAGYGGFVSSPSTSRSPFRAEIIPPLPPIPRRRPAEIITDYEPPFRSSGALSADDTTPDSATRALAEVQEELYTMLGISMPSSRLRRSRSEIGLPSAGLSPPPLSARFNIQRRPSLPGQTALMEAQNAILADNNAVVATFEMLQDEL